MDRICSTCGAHFEGQSKDTRCQKCRLIPTKVLRKKICKICGKTYETYGTRSLYCESCAAERRKANNAEYQRRKRQGKTRELGSIDTCERCGMEYIVCGGMQRFCQDCAKERRSEAALDDFYNNFGKEKREARINSRVIATATCIVCGKPFLLDGKREKCCSEECMQIRKKQLCAQYRDDNPKVYAEKWEKWYSENKQSYLEKKKNKKKERKNQI